MSVSGSSLAEKDANISALSGRFFGARCWGRGRCESMEAMESMGTMGCMECMESMESQRSMEPMDWNPWSQPTIQHRIIDIG